MEKTFFLLRKERGLTLSELAEKAHVAKSYLSNIERCIHQNPSIQIVEKISQVLDVDVKTLLNGEMKGTVTIETEWIDFIEELKKSGIKKEDIQEYKTLIEFIKWKNEQAEEVNSFCFEGKHE